MLAFIEVFVLVVTKIRSISVICWYLLVLANQLKMFRFIKVNIDTDMNILKFLGINMEPTLYLPSSRNIPNTMTLKGFYYNLVLRSLHSFPKLFQDIIFFIDGQCCVLIEIISCLEKPLMQSHCCLKETRCLGCKLTFLK